MKLPMKLGIGVVLLFAVVIAACLLWTPLRTQYYLGKYQSDRKSVCAYGIAGLVSMGEKGEIIEVLKGDLEIAGIQRKILIVDAIMSREELKFLIMHVWPDGIAGSVLATEGWPEIPECQRGLTRLHNSVDNGYRVTSEILIAKGVDIDALDSEGRTPLDIAVNANDLNLENLLRAHGAKTGEELRKERESGK